VEESYRRTFERPSFEVDRRIVEDEWHTQVDVGIAMSERLGLTTGVSIRRFDVPGDQEFLGADLTRNLSRAEYRGAVGFKYRLTPKTSAVFGGDHQLDRFNFERSRNGDSNRIFTGFAIASPTRLEGRAVGGVRLLRFTGNSKEATVHRAVAYAEVDLRYHFGAKTHVRARYMRDLEYSAFILQGPTPMLTHAMYGLRFEEDLWRRFNLLAFANRHELATDGTVTIKTSSGEQVTKVRDDGLWETGMDFGYRFRGGLRIGIAAVYASRASSFSEFAIEGLVVGATIAFQPGLSYAASLPH
jgi:hypothetical protein